tara:strand:- start:24 stop:182 length:159 start_codon:yes stop_codon:yes gene_type:complete
MEGKQELIFTHHVIPNCWVIIVIQDAYGNLVNIVEEPLESDIEFEMDFEVEL